MSLSSCFYVVSALTTRIVLSSLNLNYTNMNNFIVPYDYISLSILHILMMASLTCCNIMRSTLL